MERCCPGWQNALLKVLLSVGKKLQELQVRQKDKQKKRFKQENVILLIQYSTNFILKLILHTISVSLTGSLSSSTKDAPQGQAEKKGNQEETLSTASHPGYGACKKFPYIDE